MVTWSKQTPEQRERALKYNAEYQRKRRAGLIVPAKDKRMTRLREAAAHLLELKKKLPFTPSARGLCYLREQLREINKDEFARCEEEVGDCIKTGLLPVDFVTLDEARDFTNIVPFEASKHPNYTTEDMLEYAANALNCVLSPPPSYIDFHPEPWRGETYYVQMLVEKIDLVTMWQPICRRYHVPIATAKGWSSRLQRALMMRRFHEAEQRGLKCVLLYAGDFDPDGLRINMSLKENLRELNTAWFEGGQPGDIAIDVDALTIDRFGLNKDFIVQHGLTWIDNLKTGSGGDLADPGHKNHKQDYVQKYLAEHGAHKVEANALVVIHGAAMKLCEQAINKYYDPGFPGRVEDRRLRMVNEWMTKNRDAYKAVLDRVTVNGAPIYQHIDDARCEIEKLRQGCQDLES